MISYADFISSRPGATLEEYQNYIDHCRYEQERIRKERYSLGLGTAYMYGIGHDGIVWEKFPNITNEVTNNKKLLLL